MLWQFTKDERLAGLDADAGEMKSCSGADQGRLDQIEFAGGHATCKEEKIRGSRADDRCIE